MGLKGLGAESLGEVGELYSTSRGGLEGLGVSRLGFMVLGGFLGWCTVSGSMHATRAEQYGTGPQYSHQGENTLFKQEVRRSAVLSKGYEVASPRVQDISSSGLSWVFRFNGGLLFCGFTVRQPRNLFSRSPNLYPLFAIGLKSKPQTLQPLADSGVRSRR